MQVVVCPGQGAQRPAMLSGWLPVPGAAELLERYSAAADLDLIRLGTQADAAEINDTAVAQPLIVATELLSYRLANPEATLVAGHSVGMVAAYAIAGAYDDETAIKLAADRGRIFQQVASSVEMGMSAIIGKGVLPRFTESEWGRDSGLDLAVVNSDSQIVVGGPKTALARLASSVPSGIRVTPLAVSGAFHTEAMRPAVEPFATMLQQIKIRDPKTQVISDLTGQPFSGGEFGFGSADDIVQHLITQITHPVRWDLVAKTLSALVSTRSVCRPTSSTAADRSTAAADVVELAPAGTLVSLLKRAIPQARLEALKPETV